MLNRVTKDVHGAIAKCWSVLPDVGQRETDIRTMLALSTLTASPPSPSFPRSPPDLSIAGPVVPRDTGAASLYRGPLSLDARFTV